MLRTSVMLVLAGLVFTQRSASQTVDEGYAVGTWKGFRAAAVTYTFDDNDDNQLAVAVPLFDAFDFDVTLFATTNVDWSPIDWAGLAAAAERGHEVASHTVTHPRLSELTPAQQTAELAGSKNAILDRIPGAAALTIAYPFCVRSDEALAEPHYIAARGCQGFVEQTTPADMMNVSSIIVGSEGSVKTAADLNVRVDEAAGTGGWAVFLIHGVDDDGGWSPVASSELSTHLAYIDLKRDTFWVAPFGEVVRYVRERDAASVREVSANDSTIVVHVTDTLDDAVYDEAITIRRVLPGGWKTAAVTQHGEGVPARIVEVEGVRHVLFDVVPDAGDVVLSTCSTTSAGRRDER